MPKREKKTTGAMRADIEGMLKERFTSMLVTGLFMGLFVGFTLGALIFGV